MDKNLKTALIIGGVVLAILIILPTVSGLIWGGQYEGWGMMGPWMMGGYGLMGAMGILWIVLLGLIIWGVVAAVRHTGGPGSTNKTPDTALEVLKKRYARGEIAKEEYEAKKKDLE